MKWEKQVESNNSIFNRILGKRCNLNNYKFTGGVLSFKAVHLLFNDISLWSVLLFKCHMHTDIPQVVEHNLNENLHLMSAKTWLIYFFPLTRFSLNHKNHWIAVGGVNVPRKLQPKEEKNWFFALAFGRFWEYLLDFHTQWSVQLPNFSRIN